jgi:hypothetical protein
MRAIPGLILALLLLGGGLVRASDADSFLKTGATYYIWAATGSPVPFQATHSGNGSTATVKIIQYGVNQWYWVEFDAVETPAGSPALIYKRRRWVNFAQVLGLELADEPNYQQLYPQGFKIVPYDGLGP